MDEVKESREGCRFIVTSGRLEATPLFEEFAPGCAEERKSVMKRVFARATEVVVLSAQLYRELALSALSILPVASLSQDNSRDAA
jgi:hypothetical protein